jgi:hypothetical protein
MEGSLAIEKRNESEQKDKHTIFTRDDEINFSFMRGRVWSCREGELPGSLRDLVEVYSFYSILNCSFSISVV